MFVDDPGAAIGFYSQDASLQLGIRMVADPLLQCFQEAVGQAFEG
jgi:hypothetical protein